MDDKQLKTILREHVKWANRKGGRRADLQGAELRRADLRRAYLQGAYLQGADLQDADLQGADLQDADLRRAYLQGADLRRADLRDADLQGAELRRADLRGADLQGADLQDADLRRAYLQGANLRRAKNAHCAYLYRSPLVLLKSQPGKLRAYKYLVGGVSPYQYASYEVSKTYMASAWDEDEYKDCGAGLNVATLEWCIRDATGKAAVSYLEVEFAAKDIVAIPYWSDGKFRVRQFKVIRQVPQAEIDSLLAQREGDGT